MSNVSNTVKHTQDYTVSNKSFSVVSSKVTNETTGKNHLSPVDTEHQEYKFPIL